MRDTLTRELHEGVSRTGSAARDTAALRAFMDMQALGVMISSLQYRLTMDAFC